MTRSYRIDTVIFDCDSTLSSIEGIDELARRAGVYEQLAPLTDAAMAGELKLDEVYKKRLELIRPGKKDIDWLGTEYIKHCLVDAAQVIDTLQKNGKAVHIVSGGIRQSVLILAEYLGVPSQQVHAVDLQFDKSGDYAGYDKQSPLTMNGGKKTVCRNIIGAVRTAIMIGDGMTDLEAAQDRVAVIGFGGVVNRDVVRNAAIDFIDTPALSPLLELLSS